MQTNIQGPVKLDGRGMVYRPHGDYEPGEFKQLINAEIEEGRIRGRRGIGATKFTGLADFSAWSCRGKLGNYLIYANLATGEQKAILMASEVAGSNSPIQVSQTTMFHMSTLSGLTASDESRLCYTFNYNNKNYFLLTKAFHSTATKLIQLQFNVGAVAETVPMAEIKTGIGTLYGNMGSLAANFTGISFNYDNTSDDPATIIYKNAFMFKDRLWVVLNNGVYFSKATDPAVFTTPNGGFFRFPDESVNYAIALNSTIYIFTDSKVYALTYSTDPNSDATIRVITDQFGGLSAAIAQDTVYFNNSLGIYYIVNGNFVNKVADSSEFGSTANGSLTAFGSYLVFNKEYYNFDLSPYVTRINKFRDGYVTTTSDIAKFIPAGASTVLSRDNAAGSVGFGLSSTSALKTVGNGTSGILDFWSQGASGGVYNIAVSAEETLVYSVWCKTNLVPFVWVDPVINISDAAGANYYSVGWNAPNTQTLASADGWKQFTFTFTVPKTSTGTANPPAYASIQLRFTKQSGGGTFAATDIVWSNLFVAEVYRNSSVPYLYASNNDTAAKLYVGSNNVYGDNKIYYNPLPGAGLNRAVVNSYKGSTDFSDTKVQTYLLNLENNSIHAITTPNRGLGQANSAINDVEVLNFLSNYTGAGMAYTGPILVLNEYDTTSSSWNLNVMLEDRDFYEKALGYRDSIYTSPAGTSAFYAPNVMISIENFVPDGNMYMMKKFRSVELQGKFPGNNADVGRAPMSLSWDFDGKQVFANSVSVEDTLNEATVFPAYPHRVGLNARGHGVSLKLSVPSLALAAQPWGILEISDIRVLWNYIGRGPIRKQRATADSTDS